MDDQTVRETYTILPCPFCGSPGVIADPDESESGYRAWVYVFCRKCGARGGVIAFHIFNQCGGIGSEWRAPYERQAVALWNNRQS